MNTEHSIPSRHWRLVGLTAAWALAACGRQHPLPPMTEPSTTQAPPQASSPPAAAEHPDPPPLESMASARPSAKMSVPVDLRYSFDGEIRPQQPVTLHLAAVPRAAGTNLTVSVKPVPGIDVAPGPLQLQKTGAHGAYRQQLSITRAPGAPAELRVLVTMDLPMGSGFGFFSIPLD